MFCMAYFVSFLKSVLITHLVKYIYLLHFRSPTNRLPEFKFWWQLLPLIASIGCITVICLLPCPGLIVSSQWKAFVTGPFFLCLSLTTKHCVIDLYFKLQVWHDQKQHVALRGIKPASSTQLGFFFSTWGGQHVLMPFCILICKFSSYHLKYFKLTCMDRSQEALPRGSSWYLWQWRVEVRVLVP